jgi:hypothetical protein
MLGISGDRLLSRAHDKHPDETLERRGIVSGYCAVGTSVILIRAKSALRHYRRSAGLVIPIEKPNLSKIAGGPAAQFLKPHELALIMPAPTARIGGLRRSLEFDESARRRSLSHERNVWPPDARVSIFGHNDQCRCGRQTTDNPFDQLLESGSQGRLRNVRVGTTQVPNSAPVVLQKLR